MLPPAAVKVTKLDFHAIDAPKDQAVDRLSALVTQSARSIVPEAVVGEALRGPTLILDCQPEEQPIVIWSSKLPLLLSTQQRRLVIEHRCVG
jgi:hypothetical protein